jgi:hypothetical protein
LWMADFLGKSLGNARLGFSFWAAGEFASRSWAK